MKKITLKHLKKLVNSNLSVDIDFRRDVFCENEFGATPCMTYNRTYDILISLYDSITDEYGDFWEYNMEMQIDKLKSSTLKSLFQDKVIEINNLYLEKN